MKSLPSNSIDLSVYSPPFSDLFTYSDHISDMGNTANYDEFFKQYKYAIKELFRITRDKRLTVIHCKDLPLFKWKDGFVGMQDFSGDIITNPPYKYALEFVEHALNIVQQGRKVAMFLKLTILEGKARKAFFKPRFEHA